MLYKNTVEKRTLELLIKLQSNPEFSNFYLAGGTALALQIGHRKSIDLDFFSLHDFDNNYLLEFLEHDFEFYLDYSDKNTLKGSINDIKIDILSHKYPLVKQVVKYDRIILYSVEDIIAMKLNAIAGNGTRSKDFIDIYFTLNPHYSPTLYTKHINTLVYSLLKMGFANFIKPKFGCLGIIFMHLLRCKTLEIPKYSFGFRRLASA